jgi:hypothetical protein
MNTTLTVDDPLAEQEVTLVITLAAGEQARDERLAQVSVGITGQPPVTRTGTFGQVTALIDEAWTAFGVLTQVAVAQGAATQGSARQETKSAGEMTDTAVPGAQETTPQPHTPAPEPQPDLSFLF